MLMHCVEGVARVSFILKKVAAVAIASSGFEKKRVAEIQLVWFGPPQVQRAVEGGPAEIQQVWFGSLRVQLVVEGDLLIFSGLGKIVLLILTLFCYLLRQTQTKRLKKYEKLYYCVSELHFASISGRGGSILSKKVKIVVPCCTWTLITLIFIVYRDQTYFFNIDCCTKGAKLFHLNNQKCMSIPVSV
jgi:hypothetical protein